MNRPSRNDEDELHPDWNQSPHALSGDLTTRSDLNGIVNSRKHRGHRIDHAGVDDHPLDPIELISVDGGGKHSGASLRQRGLTDQGPAYTTTIPGNNSFVASDYSSRESKPWIARTFHRTLQVLIKYAKFVGPGVMISVAYIDPGNYATDVAAGATYRFRLLFMVMVSNIFAIFLQSLCIKVGSVTGLNLAELIKENTPPWLNYTLYIFGEAAIIATDIAEVIGTAIALNLLFHLPLVAGCAISILDVLIILIFYKPSGSMRGLRLFELLVAFLVLGVVVCFCYQLSLIKNTAFGDVFKGYLPSKALVEPKGLYQACGILGATVMPHSLYLGSGIVQSRLKDFDEKTNNIVIPVDDDHPGQKYRPSITAIRSCMKYSMVELALSLFVFALFVNSAILIVAGASLSELEDAESADLFSIHDLLSRELAPIAGTLFALALLLSGTSAGIVCTIAGQMICEGQLTWTVKPWVRRFMTRSLSITPSIIIAGAVGKEGLSAALEASQVALSVILPFVSAPLIYFTCRNKYMTISPNEGDGTNGQAFKMANHWITSTIAVIIWIIIVVMNVAVLVLLGMGIE